MVSRFETITKDQVQAFALGHVVELNDGQMTSIIRYMTKDNPIAIVCVGDKTYRAVSIRRTTDGDAIAEALLGPELAVIKANAEEILTALSTIVEGYQSEKG